ncbi:MAG: hypothetical protein ACFFBP_11615, partial [Promethearchaeota archaeon]
YDYYYEYWVPKAIPLLINEFADPESTLSTMMPAFIGMDTKDIALMYFLEQWANCSMFEGGVDFHTVDEGIPAGTFGLEVNRPNPSGIPLNACYALWDETNELSFLDMTNGIQVWKDAEENTASRQILLDEFGPYGLTLTQLYMILNWLWKPGGFSDRLVPILIESEAGYGVPMDEFCFQLLLGQWANGTVFGEKMFPDGFPLPLVGGERYGFEVGIPEPTGMSLESALALWNPESDYSLVNPNGLAKWFAAVNDDTSAYAELMSANGLTDHAMACIINWIPNFQQNVMPYLAQHQYGLPTDSITLGNIIQIGGIGLGGLLVGIGAVSITGSVVAKRRKISRSKVSSKKAIGKITNTPPLDESLEKSRIDDQETVRSADSQGDSRLNGRD